MARAATGPALAAKAAPGVAVAAEEELERCFEVSDANVLSQHSKTLGLRVDCFNLFTSTKHLRHQSQASLSYKKLVWCLLVGVMCTVQKWLGFGLQWHRECNVRRRR